MPEYKCIYMYKCVKICYKKYIMYTLNCLQYIVSLDVTVETVFDKVSNVMVSMTAQI